MAKYRFDQIATNSTEKKKPVEEDRFTYLGLEHLDSGSLKVTRFGSDVAPIGEKLVMRKGDVLFGKRRAYQKKVAIAPFDGIFSAHGMVLRPNVEVIDPDFFPLFISSDYFLDAAIKISVGSLSPTINWRDLKILEFDLPDLETQRKLAAVLWSINDTMESYKKLISATDELVKSQFIERFGLHGKNSNGYPVKPIAEISEELFAGGDKPSDHSPMQNEEYPYPVYSNGEGSNGLLCFSKNYRVDKEAITVSARGAIGYSAIRAPYFTPVVRLLTIVPKTEMNIVFLKYFIDASNLTGTGSSQGQLTLPEFKKLMVPVPPLNLQEQFAAFVRQSDKSKLLVSNLMRLKKKNLHVKMHIVSTFGYCNELNNDVCDKNR